MGDKTGISWCDATWNPIVGCSIVAPGCTNCYAMRMAARIERMQPGGHYAGTTDVVNGRPVWTGKVTLAPDHILTAPLRWKRPRRIFVNSMGDVFHPKVRWQWIDDAFAIMALAPQHQFILLTKRPEHMLGYVNSRGADVWEHVAFMAEPWGAGDIAEKMGGVWVPPQIDGEGRVENRGYFDDLPEPWPLPNVHLGVSVSDQATADAMIPPLLNTTAAVRVVSYEPALGPVNFSHLDSDAAGGGMCQVDALTGRHTDMGRPCPDTPRIGHLIIGGESGPNARPCNVDWIRSAVAKAKAACVPVFVKQLGTAPVPGQYFGATIDAVAIRHRSGADPSEWPEDLRVQEYPR